MTKILLVAALMTSASVAMASKSRVDSLQGSMTVATDFQDTLSEPARMFEVSDAFTLEYGGSQTATTKGEAGLIRTAGDSKWGVYLGRQPTALTDTAATAFGTAGALHYIDNPLYLSYAMKGGAFSWGVGLYYASSAVKTGTAQNKKDVMSLNASLLGANWGAYINQGLTGKIQSLKADGSNDDQVLTSKSSTKIGGRYDMEDISIGGSYAMSGGKFEGNGTTDASVLNADNEKTTLMVNVESKIKTDNAHFFYGAGLKNETSKDKKADTKTDVMTVPLTLGIEAEAASWMTLRGAYTQALSLLDSSKETKPSPAVGIESQGTSAHALTAGAGWKFNKTHIDFDLTAGTGGVISANTIGTKASMTYWF